MMTNLFSIFDPSSSIFNLSFNWLSMLLGMFIIPKLFWIFPNRYNILWNLFIYNLNKEFKILLMNNYKGMSLMFISYFIFILMNNFISMFPYIFTSTSHLLFTLSLSLPFWFSLMIFGWINKMQYMFMHMIPQGTPNILMPFMLCIETISNLIRPGTLAIRLSANMIAGHLLLSLMSNSKNIIPLMYFSLLLISQILLLILEFAVSIIQSYVFAILTTLYTSEIH